MKSLQYIQELQNDLQQLYQNENFLKTLQEVITLCTKVFKEGRAVYFGGNGGSAAEAMHLAAEFSGRYKMDRKPLNAECLASNPSFMTAVGNDYGYDHVFSRAIEACGKTGDVLFLLSTSGNSNNILLAAQKAKEMGIRTVAMTGRTGGKLAGTCDLLLAVPSDNVPRIQEIHLLTGHIICEEVEKNVFSS